MERKDFICCINEEFVIISAFNKADAYLSARVMGYKGKMKDIRYV